MPALRTTTRSAYLFLGAPPEAAGAPTSSACAAWDVLHRDGARPDDAIAAHGLGLHAALYAAGALDRDAAVRLSCAVAREVEEDAEVSGSGLLRIAGIPLAEAGDLALRAGAALAHIDSPIHVVVGGDEAALAQAAELARAAGALEVARLPGRGALHTARCAGVAARISALVAREVTVRAPGRRILAPGRARWLESCADVRDAIAASLAAPVRWHATLLKLRAAGYERLVPVPPRP